MVTEGKRQGLVSNSTAHYSSNTSATGQSKTGTTATISLQPPSFATTRDRTAPQRKMGTREIERGRERGEFIYRRGHYNGTGAASRGVGELGLVVVGLGEIRCGLVIA